MLGREEAQQSSERTRSSLSYDGHCFRGPLNSSLDRHRKKNSMGARILLGAATGIVVSLLSWKGNQTENTVSTFPDLVTFLALAGLTFLSVWFYARRSQSHDAGEVWRAGATIAASAGLLFGTTVVVIGVARLGEPHLQLLASGFVTGLVSSLACGAVASALVSLAQNNEAPTV